MGRQGTRGGQGLTRREKEILQEVARGLSNQEVAHRLGISEGTVRSHLRNAFLKLEARNRTEAVARLLLDAGGQDGAPAARPNPSGTQSEGS